MKNLKKQLWVFVFIKYGKFWSVSPELSIKHKPLISEECICSSSVSQALMNNSFCCEFRIQWRYIHTHKWHGRLWLFIIVSSPSLPLLYYPRQHLCMSECIILSFFSFLLLNVFHWIKIHHVNCKSIQP